MSTITVEGWLYYDTDKFVTELGRYRFFGGKRLENFVSYIPICPHTLVVDIGNFDPRPQQVKALEAKRAELNKQFSAAVMEINRQISELQAIEYTPAVEVPA